MLLSCLSAILTPVCAHSPESKMDGMEKTPQSY